MIAGTSLTVTIKNQNGDQEIGTPPTGILPLALQRFNLVPQTD